MSEFPTVDELEPVAEELKEINPDVVLSCVYDCINWHTAMRNVNWSPKAQVFTICVTQENYQDALGDDVEYMMGVGDFDESLKATDGLTGWTAKDFANLYKAASSDAVVHGAAAAGAAAMSILIQAMEGAGTATDANVLADYLSKSSFSTTSGDSTFDANGQSELPLLLVQYDTTGTLQTTFPVKQSSGSIVYPMPTWEGRDCVHKSDCVKFDNHTCTLDGFCTCPPDFVSLGQGRTARCVSYDIYYGNQSDSTWSSPTVIFGIVAACFVAMAMAAWGLNERRKRRNDAVWKVSKSDLVFHDPPVVVGRGTFGEVLLAEYRYVQRARAGDNFYASLESLLTHLLLMYRGTDVAVKRVIPPKKTKKGSKSKDSSLVQQSASNDGSSGHGTASGYGTASTGLVSNINSGLRSGMVSGGMMSKRSSGINGTKSGMMHSMMIGRSEKAERRKLERDFVSEMRYLSKLRHPCVTTVMGKFICSSLLFVSLIHASHSFLLLLY